MAVDQGTIDAYNKMWGGPESITLETALAFAKLPKDQRSNMPEEAYQIIIQGGSSNLGANTVAYAYEKAKRVTKLLDEYVAQQTAGLKAINPAFDFKNYYFDQAAGYDAGEGASANRNAPIVKAYLQAQSQIQALQKAQEAAKVYQETGKIEPFPSKQQLAQEAYPNLSSKYLEPMVKRAGGEITEAEKSTANAAAARAGAPLPYPTSSIGQIGAGGIFQTPEQAKQAYTNGQLNTVGQNIVASNSAANMKGGVNQATVNPDGTVSWNGQTFPNKDAAALAANAGGVTSLRFGDGATTGGATTGGSTGPTGGTTGGTVGGSTGSNATGTSATGAAGFSVDPQAQAQAMGILNQYLNDGTIDNGTYQMFKKAVELWDPSQEVDYANILNTFETIKQTDINPYFQEQAALFTADLEANRDYLIQNKVLEQKNTDLQRQDLKEGMQKNLANSGLMFTGEGVKQLGNESAFATEGTPEAARSPLPTISPFADGKLQQQTQVASSANDLRYQKSLQDLQRQAESYLGTTGSAGLVPGGNQIGGITGSLVKQQKAAQASTLTGLYNQQSLNVGAQSGQESQIFNAT